MYFQLKTCDNYRTCIFNPVTKTKQNHYKHLKKENLVEKRRQSCVLEQNKTSKTAENLSQELHV